MVVRKKSKSHKRRAHTTHGYGSMKKNRGAGNRGGRGNAGTGKRGDSKKPSINPKTYFGRKSMRSYSRKIIVPINVQELDSLEFEKKDDFHLIDLTKKNFNKLLGKGFADKKYKILVEEATDKAIEKIKAKGGEVVLSKQKE